MLKTLISCFLTSAVALASSPQSGESDPSALFRQLGLDEKQIEGIDKGQPVAKVLSWGGSSEVHVFGAVHIDLRGDIRESDPAPSPERGCSPGPRRLVSTSPLQFEKR